jgi:hypothetical protein
MIQRDNEAMRRVSARRWFRPTERSTASIKGFFESMLPSDERVDAWLDRLRAVRLPVLVQVFACWIAVGGVLVYYCLLHAMAYQQQQSGSTNRVKRLPLMLEPRKNTGGDNQDCNYSDRETYKVLQEQLLRHGLLIEAAVSSQLSVRDRWVDSIRADARLRRLVSRFMQQLDEQTGRHLDAPLWDWLDSIYPDLLPLPSSWDRNKTNSTAPGADSQLTGAVNNNENNYPYEVSVVVPFHDREPPELVRQTLEALCRHCRQPNRVQLVVVRAVDSDQDSNAFKGDDHERRRDDDVHAEPRSRLRNVSLSSPSSLSQLIDPEHFNEWGDVKLVTHQKGGGRGPTLNAGAAPSRGRVVAFVHSDCRVPVHWDIAIRSALADDDEDDGKCVNDRSLRVVATAFRLGIDCSETSWFESLLGFPLASTAGPSASEKSADIKTDRRYPWGIRAVQLMVNLRSHLLKMPYGDQVLAMRASDFFYLGGFPEQPIMEDFDLVAHLRRRSCFTSAVLAMNQRETLRLLPSTCWCSPRRWQKNGVMYVTLANAVLVHRYTRQEDDPRRWGPDRIFEYYYHGRSRDPAKHEDKVD